MSKNYTTDLDKIIEQQEALLSSLKNEAKQLDGNRLLEENKALTAKLQVADEKNALKMKTVHLNHNLPIQKMHSLSKWQTKNFLLFHRFKKA